MSGVFESSSRWIWSFSINFRRFKRASSSWSPIVSDDSKRIRSSREAGDVAALRFERAMLGPHRFEAGGGIVVRHPGGGLPHLASRDHSRASPDQP